MVDRVINHEAYFSSAIDSAINDTLGYSILPQAGSGFRWVITDMMAASTQSAADMIIKILGPGTQLLWNLMCSRGAGGASPVSLKTPILCPENAHVYVQASAASASAYVSISGYKERIQS